MATNIDEAMAEARIELLSKEWVIAAEIDNTVSEDKPGNYIRKRLTIIKDS